MTSWEIHEGRSFVFCRQSPGTLARLTTEGRRLRELIVGRVHIGILRHRQSKRHSRSRVCNSTDGISQSDSTRSEHVGIETRLALMAVSYSLQHPRVLVPGFRIEVDHPAASSRSMFLLQKDCLIPAPCKYSRGTAGDQWCSWPRRQERERWQG